MYVDPYKIEGEPHDADIIFCTHTHTDHFSEEDILKVKHDKTILVGTEDCLIKAMKLGFDEANIRIVEPNEKYEVLGIGIETVPAYNIEKNYHPKENNWVGYILEINDIHYYIAGDTDLTQETKAVTCDVAFVPVGGRYTMNAKEAASLINTIEPQIAIPIHYGDIIGSIDDAELFKKLVKENIEVKIFIK
jgi:L-ascorbate metabolism protein UlaG (beta-lactamase superfamily)